MVCMMSRRRSKAWRISATAARSPDAAASAARWDTLATLEVLCHCRLVGTTSTTSVGPKTLSPERTVEDRVEGLDIHAQVSYPLCSVDQQASAGSIGLFHDLRDGDDRARGVGDVGDGD